MDHYSILDPGLPTQPGMPMSARIAGKRDIAASRELPAVEALNIRAEVEPPGEPASSRMRAPREDYPVSLAELAESDLDAILQLLAERAEYITNATGAAIALQEGEEMVCRASAGLSAPVLGARLQVDSGLSGESIRTRLTLRCDDAEVDARVNRESCRSLGIASVVVMPLVHRQGVGGLFELFSDRPYAFSERDLNTLERLGEMVHTALKHAEAAIANPGVLQVEAQPVAEKPAPMASADLTEVTPVVPKENPQLSKPDQAPIFHASTKPAPATAEAAKAVVSPAPANVAASPRALVPELANIRKCETCGFPVSAGRKLCLDCEGRQQKIESGSSSTAKKMPSIQFSPQFLNGGMGVEQGLWIFRNRYFTAGLVVVALLVIALLLSHW